jgi:hypothetical protein
MKVNFLSAAGGPLPISLFKYWPYSIALDENGPNSNLY